MIFKTVWILYVTAKSFNSQETQKNRNNGNGKIKI